MLEINGATLGPWMSRHKGRIRHLRGHQGSFCEGRKREREKARELKGRSDSEQEAGGPAEGESLGFSPQCRVLHDGWLWVIR